MRLPVDLLQVQEQRAVVDARRHLTHAAAQLFRAGAAGHIDRGREIALGCGPLADDIIEGEDLAGVQNRAVDGLTGQAEVVGSVGVGYVRGGHLVQRRAEHLAGEVQLRHFRLDVLHLNHHRAAGSGGGELLVGLLQVKAVAGHFFGDGVGLLVILGVLHLGAVLLVIRRQVHQLAGRLLILPGQGGEVGVHKGVVHRLIEPVGVQLPVRIAHLHGDGAGSLVEGDLRRRRLLLYFLGQLVNHIADVLGVQIQNRLQIDVMLRAAAGEVVQHCREGIAGAAVSHGLGDGLIGIQGHVGLIRREGQRPVRQLDVEGGRGIRGSHGVRHRAGGLLRSHAADVDAGDEDIGVDGVSALEDEAVAEEDHCRQHHQGAGNNARQQAAGHSALFPGLGRLLRLGRSHDARRRRRRTAGLPRRGVLGAGRGALGLGSGLGRLLPGRVQIHNLGRLLDCVRFGGGRRRGLLLVPSLVKLPGLDVWNENRLLLPQPALALAGLASWAGLAGWAGAGLFKLAFLSDGNRSYLFCGLAAGITRMVHFHRSYYYRGTQPNFQYQSGNEIMTDL